MREEEPSSAFFSRSALAVEAGGRGRLGSGSNVDVPVRDDVLVFAAGALDDHDALLVGDATH